MLVWPAGSDIHFIGSFIGTAGEGNHFGGRNRISSLSGDDGGFETASARVRQADDLLPVDHADASRHSRHADHFDRPRPAVV